MLYKNSDILAQENMKKYLYNTFDSQKILYNIFQKFCYTKS